MEDPAYKTYLDSLTFGDDTTIGYFDLSDPLTPEQCGEDKAGEAGDEQAAGGKWIKDKDMKLKLEHLSSLSRKEGTSQPASNEQTTGSQIVFLAAYGLPKNRALALKRDHFHNIMNTCDFPPVFLKAMCENTGYSAYFTEDAEKPGWISMVVKTPHSASNFSLVLRTRISDRATICLLIIEDDAMLESLLARLHIPKTMKQLQESPLRLLSIICEEYGHRNELWREELDISIVSLEQRIVPTEFDIENFGEGIVEDESLGRNLHETNTNLTWLDCTTNFELSLLQLTREVVERCEEMREEQNLTTFPKRCCSSLEQEIRSLMSSCENRRYHGRGLQERAKVQLSTLLSQISQRDSRINLSTARDSKNIARSTLRDGKVMKMIAVLGLVFLPAALLASIYSSGIVDLRAEGIVMPRLWWTYLVATIVLTLTVLMLWGVYIRRANRNEVANARQDLEKGEKLA